MSRFGPEVVSSSGVCGSIAFSRRRCGMQRRPGVGPKNRDAARFFGPRGVWWDRLLTMVTSLTNESPTPFPPHPAGGQLRPISPWRNGRPTRRPGRLASQASAWGWQLPRSSSGRPVRRESKGNPMWTRDGDLRMGTVSEPPTADSRRTGEADLPASGTGPLRNILRRDLPASVVTCVEKTFRNHE